MLTCVCAGWLAAWFLSDNNNIWSGSCGLVETQTRAGDRFCVGEETNKYQFSFQRTYVRDRGEEGGGGGGGGSAGEGGGGGGAQLPDLPQ